MPITHQMRPAQLPHTPDPWAYDEDDARIFYADGDLEPTIAYVERENATPQRINADGYILAASLKLLGACQTAEKWLTEYGVGPDTGLQAPLAQLRDAIATATEGVILTPNLCIIPPKPTPQSRKSTTASAITFTCVDADRLLGLADQFLEDWEENEGKDDPECIERRKEWNAIRPLLVAAPSLFSGYQDMAELVEAYLVHKDVSDAAFADELKAHIGLVAQIGGRV